MLIHLNNRALLSITGSESEAFLQSQLSNDISKLDEESVQINAYCQHQGKVLALFWAIRIGDEFLLSFPLDLLDSIKARLQMFVLMSDVTIAEVTEQYVQIGVIDESLKNSYVINEHLSLILKNSKELSEFKFSSQDYWDKACIDSLLPEIGISLTETFVPQVLNLDINEIGRELFQGLFSWTRGCRTLALFGQSKAQAFCF